jgi:hypothetical protein
MYHPIGFSQFVDAFRSHDRYNDFGYKALKALFEHIEEYEQDSGQPIELDVIALCCEFSTYSSALEAATEYGFDPPINADNTEEEVEEEALDYLRDNTTVIKFEGGVIVQGF